MTKKEEPTKDLSVFNDAFSDLLKEKEASPQTHIPGPGESLDSTLFGSIEPQEHAPSEEEMLEFAQEYIPPSAGDQLWEDFSSRIPMPPMDRESEARAVSIGLQEIRKMKEYMLFMYRHMSNEYVRVYATFPLLFSKDFDEEFGKTHKNLITIMDDTEHLIAGDFDNMEAVKKDFKLVQSFEEKRLSVLYDLLDHYDKK